MTTYNLGPLPPVAPFLPAIDHIRAVPSGLRVDMGQLPLVGPRDWLLLQQGDRVLALRDGVLTALPPAP